MPSTSIPIPETLKLAVKEITLRGKILVIKLGVQHDNQTTLVTISSNPENFERTLKRKLVECEVSKEDIMQISRLLRTNHKILYPDSTNCVIGNNNVPDEFDGAERPHISFDEWQSKLNEKYDLLRKVCNSNFPNIWPTFEFTLSVKNILHISDITLPFGGIILGPPSSSKTLVLEMLRDLNITFYTDSFTARSFVSHNTSVSMEQLQEIDMLPKIKDKLFITPELSPIFSSKDEELLQTLGIFTRILDGHGYESDSGAYGHRGYRENIMFAWIGAAVDIPRKVYKHLGNLGPKLYFFRIPKMSRSDVEYFNEIRSNNFTCRRDEVKKALMDYLQWSNYCPLIKTNKESIQLNKIDWNSSRDDEEVLKMVVHLGKLLSYLRGVVTTWDTNDANGSDYGYSTPVIEHPSRAMTSLINLARGHALLSGRNYLGVEDIPILIKTVLSTAPFDRVLTFDLLLNTNGVLSIDKVTAFLLISKPTAIKTMRELEVLGLCNSQKEYGYENSPLQFSLRKEFYWFLSEEFKRLREGFIPEIFDKSLIRTKEESIKKIYPHPHQEKLLTDNNNNNNEQNIESTPSQSRIRDINYDEKKLAESVNYFFANTDGHDKVENEK